MADDVKSKIAELEKELYSKDFRQQEVKTDLTRKKSISAPSWDKTRDVAAFFDEEARARERHNFMKKFVSYSIIFFVFALLAAGFIWWRGSNIVSGDKITIDVVSPLSVAGGESFTTSFSVTNKNTATVEHATLLVEYPIGFYSADNRKELPRFSKDIGSIESGQTITESVATLLYGEENTDKNINVALEYRMIGSNATLRKEIVYTTKISSSPIALKLITSKEISSGQEVDFVIDVNSNSKDPLSRLIVDATYPQGFTFQSAEPAPSYGTNIWQIPLLAPQEKRTIKIHGTIEGQENEEKVAKISIGSASMENERFIDLVYNATSELIMITRPSFALDVAINNSREVNSVVSPDRNVRVDIGWKSNNLERATDAVIEVKLKGSILDQYSVHASSGGFYRSIDDTIVWDKKGNTELGVIEPGDKGSISFGFSPITLGIGSGRVIKNPEITFEIRMRALRSSRVDSVFEETATFATRTVKFETSTRLSVKGLYYSGPFKNRGVLPPKVNQETTYTAVFEINNSSNNISNAVVKTTLPIYVKWLGVISPEGENVSYNENTGEVFWNAGRVPSGGTRTLSFQISFLPSISQINQSPTLTGAVYFTGIDDFTKTGISAQKAGITTYLISDSMVSQNQGVVVK